ncbi:MAG: NADH-quinone oxidoreductase subunit K [Holosporales bacterium]|jgi:NADH:ubiquinone oxidoreductase subunit K|nr:NADH-quinone oxidoreductase subunit K [Holosporales bacterium]
MSGCENIVILSGFLFCIGLLGLVAQSNVVKIIISIEIMIFASIINFSAAAGDFPIKSGHLMILVAVVLGGLVLGVVFTIFNSQIADDRRVNLLDKGRDNDG